MAYVNGSPTPASAESQTNLSSTLNTDHGSRPAEMARQYVEAGLGVVALRPKDKRPAGTAWQTPAGAITDPDRAKRISGGVGIHHLSSRTCAVDVDEWEVCAEWLAARGVDLAALFMDSDAVQIKSNREGRGKLLFRLPDSVEWLPYVKTASGKLELRCANGPEQSQQDVLPPSVHPETGNPYAWGGDWQNLPTLPDDLLAAWLTAKGQAAKKPAIPREKGANGTIGAFNAAHSPGEILERHGYKPTSDGKRWQYPDSTTGTAGVVALPDTDPPRVYTHHPADPLADGHAHDAFSVFTVLEHGGDMKAALQAIGAKTGKRSARSFDDLKADAAAMSAETDPRDIEEAAVEAAALPPITQRCVLDTIKQRTGIPLGALQATARDQSRGDDVDHLTLARQVREQIGEDNVLASDGFVWRWHDAGVWQPAEARAVRGWIQGQVADKGEQVTKALVDSVSDLFTTEVYRPGHEFNVGNPETVNTPTGELVLGGDGWTLEPHRREHYRTTQIPVSYDPAAQAPRFLQFLKEIFPESDGEHKAQALLEMIGYTLLAHSRHERFVILVGAGANGKSVLLNVIEALCGHANVAGVQPSQFDNKFQRAHLHLKLANIVTEIKQGAVIDDAALKGITSGEPTTVEHKFRDPFQMRPFATCWFGTNHMPHTRDFSDALFRRALVLQFNAVFKPEHGNHDPNLAGKLHAELPGILNLALSCYAKALREGFTMPESSEQARKEWRLEADQVAQFVDAACDVDSGARQKPHDLFQDYLKWARDSGIHRTMSEPGFRSRLEALGFERVKRNGVRWVIGLRSSYLVLDQGR